MGFMADVETQDGFKTETQQHKKVGKVIISAFCGPESFTTILADSERTKSILMLSLLPGF